MKRFYWGIISRRPLTGHAHGNALFLSRLLKHMRCINCSKKGFTRKKTNVTITSKVKNITAGNFVVIFTTTLEVKYL